jgi:hypothetical protein
VPRTLRLTFYLVFTALYVSGAAEYVMSLLSDERFGPTPATALVLRIHGLVGLGFLYLFGHFFSAHIWPSLRFQRHRRSGVSLWIGLGILCVTVPFLYYLANESLRVAFSALHTYLGLAILFPLILHITLSLRSR